MWAWQLTSGEKAKYSIARLAQSVERQALNLVVGGSSPPVGAFLLFFVWGERMLIHKYFDPHHDSSFMRRKAP